MTETQRRIEAYQKALPGIREKVTAVAMLLALSVIMLTSASFAWLTISRAPEVTAVSTTIAGNGNLEIALVNPEGTEPEESAIGDSSATKGQSVFNANKTWGNLVNLGDPAYGLDNLVLRPAQLNLSTLLTSPLYGAEYSLDGRITILNSQFGYGVWDDENKIFMISTDKGVRAISSVTIEAVGFAQQVYEKRSAVESANLAAGQIYLGITNNKAWMNSLSTIMGTFMTSRMNEGQGDANLENPTVSNADVVNLRDIFGEFIKVYEAQAQAMVELVNYQLFLKNNSETGSTPYQPYTYEMLLAETESSLKSKGLQVSGLNQVKTDLAKVEDGYAKLEVLATGGDAKWKDTGIADIVNSLMDVGKCKLDDTLINNIGASNATGYLDGKVHNAYITNGPLFNFEKINGAHCNVKNLSVSAKVKRLGITIPASITVNITTTAPTFAQFATDLLYADSLNQGAPGVQVAEDTYGLAVDIWVRTNANGSYLTLEGNILTETSEVPATGRDSNGETVNIYTITRKVEATENEEESTYTIELYKKETTTGGATTTTWYDLQTHSEFTLEEGENPIQKMDEVVTVLGYEGENRIWGDETGKNLSVDATTQGNGSCYVYYADTPEDQARSLTLLESMHVAFVDSFGTKLASASMDTEHYYAQNGRVIVPLVLDQTDSIDLGTDAEGNTIRAITELEQNSPTWITTIVYLDGTNLTNDKVLAAADIQGQLNIQFGTTKEMVPIDNEKLEDEYIRVSASVDINEFNYDTATGPMKAKITLNVDGSKPENVTAFFLRQISSTQGSREEKFEFNKVSDMKWEKEYEFKVPGKYILRTVELDGQEYVLENPPVVTVKGFTVQSLTTDGTNTILTDKSSFTTNLTLKFASSDASKLPKTVQGLYLNDETGAAVSVNFTYDPTTQNWTGSATFLTSGNYTLKHLVLDGQYTELEQHFWKTASVKLGLRVSVYTSSPTTFVYDPDSQNGSNKELGMRVEISDNSGEDIPGLNGAKLYYIAEGGKDGMSADLAWNATEGYYTGTMATATNSGVFVFRNVEVAGNNITSVTTAPRFTIISTKFPSFKQNNTNQSLFTPNTEAKFNISLKNGETATVKAVIKNLNVDGDNGIVVAGTRDQTTGNFDFIIPKDVNTGYQDGNWKITELQLWEVYDSDGYLHTLRPEDFSDIARKTTDPIILDVSNENIVTKVVDQFEATITAGQKVIVGATDDGDGVIQENEKTASFMDGGKFSNGFSLNIRAKDGSAIDQVSNVTMKLAYKDGSSASKGGYTSSGIMGDANNTTLTVNFKRDTADRTKFVQDGEVSVLYAGEYILTEFSYTVGSGNDTVTTTVSGKDLEKLDKPVVEVYSKVPYVKFTATNPSVDTEFSVAVIEKPSSEDDTQKLKNSISADGFSVTCYYKVKSSDCACEGYVASKATAQLFNIEKYNTVTFTINGTAHTVTYTFESGNKTNEQTLGVDTSDTGAGARKYIGKNVKVEQITITYNEKTFTVTLINPLYITVEH